MAVCLDIEVLAWLCGHSTEVKRTLYEQVLSGERRRSIPTRERCCTDRPCTPYRVLPAFRRRADGAGAGGDRTA
ncbi:MAG: hypothetical protein QOG25_3287 [Acetobacteraceae bacterium]|nr:hypothetical protein [Acetobacteraceae bacterium]